jgi:DNA-binding NarL/FixJ family response regulator
VLAGAHGYVLKNIDSSMLARSIRAVFNGQSILDPALIQRALSWSKSWLAQAQSSREQSLAPQEERVLALIAEGLTNKEIAATIQLSDKTVKNYLANMFQNLPSHDAPKPPPSSSSVRPDEAPVRFKVRGSRF